MEKVKVSDYEAVLAAVAKYTDAYKEGKSEIMKPAFTDNALMYGYLNGEYYHGSIEETLAVVRVLEEGWGNRIDFTDVLLLLKMNGEWKCVAKAYNQNSNTIQKG